MGNIYIAASCSIEGTVRIGFTQDIKSKLEELNTQVPIPYKLIASYKTENQEEYVQLTKLIEGLNPEFCMDNKNFFKMTISDVYQVLDIFVMYRDKNKLKKMIKVKTEKVKGKKIETKNNNKRKSKKQDPINFMKCGIHVGAELTYALDPSVTVIVYDERRVVYKNEIMYLSSVVNILRGNNKSHHGSRFFNYKNEPLTVIAERTQYKNMSRAKKNKRRIAV